MTFAAGTRFGPYEIRAQLGAGGMGEVYRANDTRLNREVALKVLLAGGNVSKDAMRRFRHEAVLLARLSHANIATLYEFDRDNGVDFLIMELVSGETLEERIDRGPLKAVDAIAIADQVASALEHAHEAGIVHQDLKPTNLILTPKGKVKVLDFGIAHLMTDPSSTTVSVINQGGGTLLYSAPEQLRGQEATFRTDIYGLGVVLYQMLTGTLPFTGPTSPMIADAILHQQPQPPSVKVGTIPAAVDRLVLNCLCKDPLGRYPSAAAFREALRDVGKKESNPTRPFVPDPASTAPVERSLIVLPARVLGSESDQYLADAIATTISTALSGVANLHILISPLQVHVERTGGDLATVMKAYAADLFVLASVIPGESEHVVHIQLVEKATHRMVWSQEIQTSKTGLLSAMRGAARGIEAALVPGRPRTLPPTETKTQAGQEFQFQNALYRANMYIHRGRESDFQLASEALQTHAAAGYRVTEATAMLALLYANSLQKGKSPAEAVPAARQWADRALAADPRSARAWAALSMLEALEPKHLGLRLEYALRGASYGMRDPIPHLALSTALYPTSLVFTLETCRYVNELDPLEITASLHQGILLAVFGRDVESMNRIEHALTIEPDFPLAIIGKAAALCMIDDYAGADRYLKEKLQPLAQNNRVPPGLLEFFSAIIQVGQVGIAGDPRSEQACAQLVSCASGEKPFPFWQVLTQYGAPLLAKIGDEDAAYSVLEARTRIGLLDPYDLLVLHRHFQNMRRHARFQTVASRSRAAFSEMLSVMDRARTTGEFPAYLSETWTRYAGLGEPISDDAEAR